MRAQAVLFDMEGTLVTFEWRLEEGEAALREAYYELGFARGSLDSLSYSAMWNKAVRHPDSPVSERELRARLDPVYDRFDLDALTRWALRPGAGETLDRLRDAGCALAVVSNIGAKALHAGLERLGIGGAFHLVLSRDDVRLMKPADEGIRRALEQLGFGADQALFVGDSRTDIVAARAAGVRVAIVHGGESDRAALEVDPPDFLLDSLREVADALDSGGVDRPVSGGGRVISPRSGHGPDHPQE